MPTPPPHTNVTIVRKNEICLLENLFGPFLVHKLLCPRPPPPSNISLPYPPPSALPSVLMRKPAGGMQGANRAYELIDRTPEIAADDADGVPMGPGSVAGCGAFEAVRFSYPSRPAAEILRELQLEFSAGQRVALLGNTVCALACPAPFS